MQLFPVFVTGVLLARERHDAWHRDRAGVDYQQPMYTDEQKYSAFCAPEASRLAHAKENKYFIVGHDACRIIATYQVYADKCLL